MRATEKSLNAKASMRDVATLADVSIATVSRCINQTGRVSDMTAAKVKDAMQILHYVPNRAIQSLLNGQMSVIGLEIPNLTNPFFAEFANKLESYARKRGYGVLLCNSNDDAAQERHNLDVFMSYRLAGAIIVRSQAPHIYERINFPVLAVENHIAGAVAYVTSDNAEGGRMAFRGLYRVGCRSFLVVKTSEKFEAAEQRAAGFLSEFEHCRLSDANLRARVISFDADFDSERLDSGVSSIEGIREIDGVFVFNDISAALFIHDLKALGIETPRDVKVVGFDDSYIARMYSPSLSTVIQSIEQICVASFDLLLEQAERIRRGERTEAVEKIIPTRLVERESTKSVC